MRVASNWGRLIAGSLACVTIGAADNAGAQSLFQSIFGGGNPPLAPAPQARAIPSASMSAAYNAQRRSSQPQPAWDGQPERAHGAGHHSSDGKGGYRTVCVRTCDGFYWPISANVSKSRFYRDSNICRSSCGSETKLFYQSASSSDAKSLIDLQGRPYSRMQTAFIYRKTLVQGCACKGEPWSQAELDRHFQYAVAAGAPRAGSPPAAPIAAEVVAGGYSLNSAPLSAADGSVPAEPIPSATVEAAANTPAPETQDNAQSASAAPEPTAADAAPAKSRSASKTAKSGSLRQTGKAPAKRIASAAVPAAAATPSQRKHKPHVAKAKSGSTQSASLFNGGGQSKYAWPGDPPTRYR